MAGCNTNPVAAVKAGLAAVTQRGKAEIPARADVSTVRTSIPLPAGTRVEVSRPAPVATAVESSAPIPAPVAAYSITIPEPVTMEVSETRETAVAPQAFAPPPPPSPSDVAAGRTVWIFRIAVFAGAVAGIFGLVRGWDFVAIGGGCVAAGGLIGLALDAVPPWLWAVLAAGGAISGTGWAVWHFKLRHVQSA